MSFQNDSEDIGSSLVFCCEIHGKIPDEQVEDFHPKQRKEPTSKERYEIKRRAKRAIHCSCGATITGSGNWKVAHVHLGLGHIATQGRPLTR